MLQLNIATHFCKYPELFFAFLFCMSKHNINSWNCHRSRIIEERGGGGWGGEVVVGGILVSSKTVANFPTVPTQHPFYIFYYAKTNF